MSTLTCALQFGSQRIMAIAALKDMHNGTLSNIQIESEPARDCISHGCIVSIENAAMHIRSLVQKLSNRMRAQIVAAHVGVGGMSLHSLVQVPSVKIPDYDVLDSLPLASSGQFQLVVGEKRLRQHIKAAMERAGIRIASFIVQPIATATILKHSERQRGCALVDMGAGTTTVVIYHQGELRHLAVIPLGGESVTLDIQSVPCSYDDAERIKCEWSDVAQEVTPEQAAGTSSAATFAEKALPIPQSRLNNIALCRYEELAANIEHQIEASGLKGQLQAGLVLTGGVAYQTGLVALLKRCLSVSDIEVRAYRESALPGSEHKPHLTSLLALLNFCTDDCQAPRATATQSTQPAHSVQPTQPAQPAKPAKPTAAPSSVTEPSLDIPDREPEPIKPAPKPAQPTPKPAPEPEASPSIGSAIKRFARDLFTPQK